MSPEFHSLTEPLLAFNVKGVVKSLENNISIGHIKGSMFHEVCGELGDNDIVKVGNIRIEIEDLIPADIAKGDFIQFSCSRLDLIK